MAALLRAFSSRDEHDAEKRISKAQSKAAEEQKAVVKLLILGAGGGGKSTLRKQFEVLYANGFKEEAKRKQLRDVVINNLIEGVRAIVTATFDSKISGAANGIENSNSLSAAAVINAIPSDTVVLTDEVVQAITTLQRDSIFVKTQMRSSLYQLQECVPFFLNELSQYPAWGGPKWIPSTEDCVRSRTRTSGIVELEFNLEGQRYRVLDAGGQRAERRKWIHAFEGVTALIFVASLTEYDETLFEDRSKNRLQESLEVFDETVNSKYFLNTPVLLFLNKTDLFIEKYVRKGVPLNVSGLFPDAPAYTPEFPKAIAWISDQYRARRVKSDPTLLVIHTTTAVDSSSVDQVFQDVKTLILNRSLQELKI